MVTRAVWTPGGTSAGGRCEEIVQLTDMINRKQEQQREVNGGGLGGISQPGGSSCCSHLRSAEC